MADDRSGVPRWLWIGLLLLAALLLTGCGSSPAQPTAPLPINNFDPAIIGQILDWFRANRGLNWRRGTDLERTLAEHRGFFVSRRAYRLLGWGPVAWITEPGHVTVRNRIDNELPQVEAFANAKLGTPRSPGPLMRADDPVTPHHLDLADVARQRPRDPPTTLQEARARSNQTQRNAWRYLNARRSLAMSIIWRAAAIHHELWDDADRLRQDALAEILDRRLHMVERMGYQIADASTTGGGPPNMSAGPAGPWPDGSRVRMFEYPRTRASYAAGHVGPIARWDARPLPPSTPPGPGIWKYEAPSQARIVYNVYPGQRIRRQADPGFDSLPDNWYPGYQKRLHDSPGLTSAQAMDALYEPSTDWWQRSWLYCDHVIASLHLSSLLLGTRRRYHGDTRFNDLVRDEDAQLGPVLGPAGGPAGARRLMSRVDDPVFENSPTWPGDLQVGDHVVFWNNPLYPLVETGEWQLENALVMGVRSVPETHSMREDQLLLQGHGTGIKTTGQYASSLLRFMVPAMNRMRAVAAAVPPGQDTAYVQHTNAHLVRWSPFGDTWSAPGPWWILVPDRWGRLPGAPPDQPPPLFAALRKAVLDDRAYPVRPPNPPRDPREPPILAYFPLWEPSYGRGWPDYLAARRAGPVRVRPQLQPVRMDAHTIPGLHAVGDARSPLPVVRPRVTP